MEVTLDQVRELADRYNACGLGGTSSGRFLQSIAISGQMPRGRGVDWINDLISKGSPQSVEPLLEEIKDLIARSKRDDTIKILNDIMTRVQAGQNLSEHKLSELERLRKQVNDDLLDLELDDHQKDLIKGLIARKRYSSYSYWASRPVISERLDQIFDRWSKHGKVAPDDWQYVLNNFKGIISEFEVGRHPLGSLRWTRRGEPATVMSPPRFDDRGSVIINVMIPSVGVLPLLAETIMIRRPK